MIEVAGIEIESIEDLWRNDRVREELIAKAWLAEIEKLTAAEDVSIGKPFPSRSGGIVEMDEIDEFYKNLPQGRCKDCKYAKAVVATGQFRFLGCYHSPYFGKWVAEIKDCPKREVLFAGV